MGGSQSSKEEKKEAEKQPEKRPAAGCLTLPAKARGGWNLPEHIVVGEPVGTGSYGSVVQAKDTKNNRPVAIKRINNLFDELTDCKRILREFALLSRLDNAHIIKLYDFIIPNDLSSFKEVYIVMEICDSDMKKLIKTDVTLEQAHIATLLNNLLVGLKYLHSASVIHRDLKPANVLCNRDCSVKICDFGLSRALPPDENHMDHREDEGAPLDPNTEASHPVVPATAKQKRIMTKHVVTRWYRAPEVILKQPKQTGQLDVWSVACIYAELLQMLEGNNFHDRGPLFPGRSCYPLSPEHRRSGGTGLAPGQPRSKYDQLVVILVCLGTPSADEVAKLTPSEGRKWLERLEPHVGDGLRKRLPKIDDASLDLMHGMLRFGPEERFTVDQCLAHSVLAEVRTPEEEKTSQTKILLPFDTEQPLGEKDLRHWFGEESKRWQTQQRKEEGA